MVVVIKTEEEKQVEEVRWSLTLRRYFLADVLESKKGTNLTVKDLSDIQKYHESSKKMLADTNDLAIKHKGIAILHADIEQTLMELEVIRGLPLKKSLKINIDPVWKNFGELGNFLVLQD